MIVDQASASTPARAPSASSSAVAALQRAAVHN